MNLHIAEEDNATVKRAITNMLMSGQYLKAINEINYAMYTYPNTTGRPPLLTQETADFYRSKAIQNINENQK